MNNALERHFRIEHQNPISHMELETKILELQDNIGKLQEIILKTNEEKDKLRDLALKQQEYLNQSWLSSILHRRHRPSDELIRQENGRNNPNRQKCPEGSGASSQEY